MSAEHGSSIELPQFTRNVREFAAVKLAPFVIVASLTSGSTAAHAEYTDTTPHQSPDIQISLNELHFQDSPTVLDALYTVSSEFNPQENPGIQRSLVEPHSLGNPDVVEGRKKKKGKKKKHNGVNRQNKRQEHRKNDPNKVKALYVLTNDAVDEGLDTNGEIDELVQSANALVAEQTGQSFIFDTNSDGRLAIDKITIDVSTADLVEYDRTARDDNKHNNNTYAYEVIDREVRKNKQLDKKNNNDILLVFSGANYTINCGESAIQPNPDRIHSTVINITNQRNCFGLSNNPEIDQTRKKVAVVHELFHTLGAVSDCAPHIADDKSHIDDNPRDVMYLGDMRQEIENIEIDPGHDDYYGENVSCGVNVQESAFLTGNNRNGKKSGKLPPGWDK